jgi:hypothetical protein
VRIDGFDALQQLEELLFSGNLLPCEDIRALPRVRKLSLSNTRFHLPLRDATRLPDMPALELLTLDTLYRLDGLERFPRLRNLTVGGNYRSLEPLTHLPALTHLYCATTEPLDLAPLCRLPELRSFNLKTEHPCDLFALTDAPKLRELTTENCDANAREVPTLQAILHSWDEDFLAPQPRPLAPLRYVVETKGRPSHGDDGCGKPGDKWAGNEGMRHSEAQWFEHRLQAAVRNFRGDAGGVKVDFGDWLTVNNVEAVHRLPELLEMARRILAECRYRRTLTVRVDFSERDEEPEEEWGDPDEVEAQRAAENRRYWKEQEREEAELREREYRLRQLRQEGVKIDPAEFAPPPPPPEVETEDDEAEEDDDDQVAHAIADEYRMHGYLTEEGFVAHSNWVADCERVLGRKMERD